MKETKLKNVILILMLLAKFLTLGVVLFHHFTNGFEGKSEALSIIVLILPLFTVYLTVMLKDIFSNPYKTKEKKEIEKTKIVKASISILTFIVFPIYFIAIFISINLRASGELSFIELQQIIALIETIFGVYVGQIIFTLFKKEEKKDKK